MYMIYFHIKIYEFNMFKFLFDISNNIIEDKIIYSDYFFLCIYV